MDSKVIGQIRQNLLERRDKRNHSEIPAEHRGELNPNQAELIDIAQNMEQMGRDCSLAEQERREVIAIEHALSKIASGNFGICEECGQEIPPRRLMVLPEARLCANCQAFEEHEYALKRTANVAFRGF